MTALALLLIGVCIAIETAEQSLYRLAGRRRGRYLAFVIPAVALNLVGLFVWLRVLGWLPLGKALPLLAVNTATVALAGKMLFGEKVNARRWLGILLIMAGFVLVAGKVQAP
jgi:drug/metabolite transporter (DMT)-like permease